MTYHYYFIEDEKNVVDIQECDNYEEAIAFRNEVYPWCKIATRVFEYE